MTVIDNKQGISYPFLTAEQAAGVVGVSVRTMYRWKIAGKIEKYNRFTVVFDEVTCTFPVYVATYLSV